MDKVKAEYCFTQTERLLAEIRDTLAECCLGIHAINSRLDMPFKEETKEEVQKSDLVEPAKTGEIADKAKYKGRVAK